MVMSAQIANKAVLGLDIGGANLKAAHCAGFTRHVPFALWKNPKGLVDVVRAIVDASPPHDVLAVTMTGELCDCFASKRDGVGAVLDAVTAAARAPMLVWTTDADFIDVEAARSRPLAVASANWLALASFAGRFAPAGQALLIDIGTTTTDIVPLFNGRPAPRGRTDPERLRSAELVYRGWRRTPLCVLMEDGAAEWFATTHDLCLTLGWVAEDPSDQDTADGQPATRSAAQRRLARMFCADLESLRPGECEDLAEVLGQRLVSRLAQSVAAVSKRLPSRVQSVIVGGSGEFLVPAIFACAAGRLAFAETPAVTSLARQLGPDISAAACAHAVAVLCAERGA
jgi:(4-(4-[2-(gamma-L-glutamylamino)ethyl]phenoxymethyl)furan-2-yl)methanamine synthase